MCEVSGLYPLDISWGASVFRKNIKGIIGRQTVKYRRK